MRRRSFISALPLAAAAVLPFRRVRADGAAAPVEPAAMPPKFQQRGAGRFERPDVHAGDRPVGASFASDRRSMAAPAPPARRIPLRR